MFRGLVTFKLKLYIVFTNITTPYGRVLRYSLVVFAIFKPLFYIIINRFSI